MKNQLTTAAWMTAIILTAADTGCQSKKELDEAVDGLVEALQKNDRSKLKSISSPALMDELPPEKTEELSAAFQNLGTYRDRTMRSINIHAGIKKTGAYVLTFDQGTVNLEIETGGGKIITFNIFGDVIDRALKKAAQEKYRELAIISFQFLKADGKPNPGGNSYKSGEMINFQITIQGLTEKNGHYHTLVHLKMLGHKGEVLAEKRDFIDQSLKAGSHGPPLVKVNGYFSGLEKGTYNLKFTIEDANDGRTIDYSQSVVMVL